MGERRRLILAFVLGLVIATAGTATAAKLITGKQIKDGTITSKDLSRALRKQISRSGKAGPTGPAGPTGSAGVTGTAGVTGPTGAVDASGFFTKAESDARYPQVDVVQSSGEYVISVPSGTMQAIATLLCPDNSLAAKVGYEATGFDQGLVSAQLDASTVDIVINNTGPNPANGTLDVKLNCFQIDPAIVPDPTFP